MDTRKCKECDIIKPLSEFDGCRKTCKECMKIWRRGYNKCNKEKISDYYKIRHAQKREEDNARDRKWIKDNLKKLKEYRSQPHIKKIMNEANKRWRAKNKEKIKADWIADDAQRRGDIIKQSCAVCGKPAEKHHDDYTRPLQIRWLCRKHHKEYTRKYKNTLVSNI